ncbi:maleylacetoacetate isomerase [Rhodoblastus sp.]|jgi:maleylpyruvate isomerase|uniref:maleylacetoacetate isomerase n=1 Tax=Rhodoblastus sp. TaxID=1962975 RepID=UPI0025FA3640|nr:maleylacetoacetate isomerase [Rhodoblastus sp.]
MKLYGYFRSSAAYRVRIALNLKGLAAEYAPVHLVRGEQRQAGFLAKNPQGLVPVLELDDGSLLTQSLAIIEYLDALQPEPRLIPTDALLAAKVRAIALAIACDIHPLNNLRVLDYLKNELHHGREDVGAWVRHWLLKGGLDSIEHMIESAPFCFGASPTLADVCLIPQIFNARRFAAPLEHLPKIKAVEAACAELPAFRAAHPSQHSDAE